jgi:hypothetical protein
VRALGFDVDTAMWRGLQRLDVPCWRAIERLARHSGLQFQLADGGGAHDGLVDAMVALATVTPSITLQRCIMFVALYKMCGHNAFHVYQKTS